MYRPWIHHHCFPWKYLWGLVPQLNLRWSLQTTPWWLFPDAVNIYTTMVTKEVACATCQWRPVAKVETGIWRKSNLKFLTEGKLVYNQNGIIKGLMKAVTSYSDIQIGTIPVIWVGIYDTQWTVFEKRPHEENSPMTAIPWKPAAASKAGGVRASPIICA